MGNTGGAAPEATIIDLRKPGDLNLVYRSVVNGWDVPQHIRDQIVEQMLPAMEFHGERKHDGRSIARVVKLCKLALLMDVSNDVADGRRRSLHPIARKRFPEKRRPRHLSARDSAHELERVLTKLALTNPALAERIRSNVTPKVMNTCK